MACSFGEQPLDREVNYINAIEPSSTKRERPFQTRLTSTRFRSIRRDRSVTAYDCEPVDDTVCFQPQGSRHRLRSLFCLVLVSNEKNRRTPGGLAVVIALGNCGYQPLTSVFYL